ncbi:hypothetical protein PV11_06543 [Exophiala sideris]|uniref:Transcription factor domain-containing protein n=1 Tax=Exophiala sideris TaxID=1016849 RepID=A0A0D1YDU4_9EURO|nr:hypothetical protein PV11_06543 [Exophiala sideris]
MKGLQALKRKLPNPSHTSVEVLPSHTSVDPGVRLSRETSRTPHISTADKDVGFLGSTAYNAVFSDNQEHMTSPSTTDVDTSNGTHLHEQITASWRSTQRRSNGNATFVLELLKDTPLLEKIIDRWSPRERAHCILDPWVEDCQRSVRRDLFEKYDLTRKNEWVKVIDLLTANTETPLRLPTNVRFREFTSYYTGNKLRWETIGVFLTVCGLSLFNVYDDAEEWDLVSDLEQDKQRLMFRLLEASDICVSFCYEAVPGTDLGFWLMLENCIHASQVLGDAHYSVWRKLGDISTAVFAHGLHEPREAADEPFWLKEVRRKGQGYAYAIDKMLSTFVGRPPRISKRYCNIKTLLDLEYGELALEGDELAEACSRLDPNGWSSLNESAKGRPSAFFRAFVLGAVIREDTLELCLNPAQDNLREKAQSVIGKSKELYASYPRWFQHTPEMWDTYDSRPTFHAVLQYLDKVYNEFMLRRMLVRHLHDDPTELILLAHEILTAVLESGAGLRWIIVLYGLPAAGVLAVELLRLNTRVVSHARIKQNLCVFVSYLKWFHVPGDGNYTLADRGRKTLQHVLDKVLATERPEPQVQPDTLAIANPAVLDPVGSMDDLSVFDFSLLDAQFDQDFWDSLNPISGEACA